jgi:hypothetical protein
MVVGDVVVLLEVGVALSAAGIVVVFVPGTGGWVPPASTAGLMFSAPLAGVGVAGVTKGGVVLGIVGVGVAGVAGVAGIVGEKGVAGVPDVVGGTSMADVFRRWGGAGGGVPIVGADTGTTGLGVFGVAIAKREIDGLIKISDYKVTVQQHELLQCKPYQSVR